MSEPIAALATVPGRSGIGVIRISGDRALEEALRIFRPDRRRPMRPRVMTLGTLYNRNGERLDRILAVWFPGPNSFTGEDLVELHCHGSIAVLHAALSLLHTNGVRPAVAGEFTKRAFINGRMDLSQAEAVGDLIESEIEEAAMNAAAQVDGVLSRKLNKIYETILLLLSHFQAVVDYPDEEIEDFGLDRAIEILLGAAEELDALLLGAERGKFLKEGVKCAIVGRPNVGKSSLLNALAGYERSIVTEVAGTTRDVVDVFLRIGGVPIRLQDTAGIRETPDAIEQAGVERAKKTAEEAGLIFAVFDGSAALSEDDRALLDALDPNKTILILNKSDLGPEKIDEAVIQKFQPVIWVSAKQGSGMEELEAAVRERYSFGDLRHDGTLITNARQEGACRLAAEGLRSAVEALQCGFAPDMVLYDVEQGLDRIGDVLGRNTPEELIETIFAKFCVGK